MSNDSRMGILLAKLEKRVLGLERARTLKHQTITNTAIPVVNETGTVQQVIGKQPDETFAVVSVAGPTPPTPTGLSVYPEPGRGLAQWNGTFIGNDPNAGVYAVAPSDFGRVEFHISSLGADFVPDVVGDQSTTMFATLESPRGGSVVTGSLPYTNADNAPITYWVKLVVRSQAGKFSAPSAAVAFTPGKLSSADYGDKSITGQSLAAEIALLSRLVIASDSNAALEIISSSGGARTVLSAALSQFAGQGTFDALEVLGKLNIRGLDNNLNGLLTLAKGVGNPGQQAMVNTAAYDSVPFLNSGAASSDSARRGLTWDGSAWLTASSAAYAYSTAAWNAAGAAVSGTFLPGGFRPLGGWVRIGSTNYVLGKDDTRGSNWYVFIFNSSWAKTGEWQPIQTPTTSFALGVDGANLVVAKRTDGGNLYVTLCNATTGADLGTINYGQWPGVTLTGVVKRAVDTATVRYVVASEYEIRVYSTTAATRITAEEWPIAGAPVYGIGHDGANWWTHDGTRMWKYTNLIGAWDFGFTWRDSDPGGSGTAETEVSTLRTASLTKRGNWIISLPSSPPDDGTTDGANTASLYAAPTGTPLVLQAALPEGVLTKTFSTLATTGPTPPGAGASGFANRVGAIGRLASTATDSDGDALTDADGEGHFRAAKFHQSGTATINCTATDTVFAQAVTFPVPFDKVPNITVTPGTGAPHLVHASWAGKSATGFTIEVIRESGASAGNTVVDWSATTSA